MAEEKKPLDTKLPDSREKIEFFYESRFYEIGKRIASFDSLKVDVQNLDHALSDALIKLNGISQEYVLERDELTKKLESLSKTIAWLQSKIETNQAKNEGLNSFQEKRIADLEDFRKNHYILEGKHAESEKKICSLNSSHDALKGQIKILSSDQESSKDLYASHSLDLSQLKSALSSLKGEMEALRSQDQALRFQIDTFGGKLSQMSSEMENKLDSMKAFFSEMIASLKRDFEKRISEIVIPDVSVYGKKADMEKLSTEFRISSLDAKNAWSKANNLENQIVIMGKKIESLLIQMKSYELERQ